MIYFNNCRAITTKNLSLYCYYALCTVQYLTNVYLNYRSLGQGLTSVWSSSTICVTSLLWLAQVPNMWAALDLFRLASFEAGGLQVVADCQANQTHSMLTSLLECKRRGQYFASRLRHSASTMLANVASKHQLNASHSLWASTSPMLKCQISFTMRWRSQVKVKSATMLERRVKAVLM